MQTGLMLTGPPTEWLLEVISLDIMWQEREGYWTCPATADIMNDWTCGPLIPVRLYDVYGDNFMFYLYLYWPVISS